MGVAERLNAPADEGRMDVPTCGMVSAMAGRALVLGGGGITGIAWEIGMLAGLCAKGIDLTAADLVVGTSAGSVVGAQVRSGAVLEELYEEQLKDPTGELSARIGLGALFRLVMSSFGDERAGRARLGRAALRARTVPESERRRVIESRLPTTSWPDGRLLIVAVDAETGEEKVFDRDSGVELVDAVAASCAVPIVWPPMTVAGRRYMDGGVRSITNADLAKGYDRVVVLAPVTVALRRRASIAAQLQSLGPGTRSAIVSPDQESRKAIGRNVLDPSRRPASAQAGRRQAEMASAMVREIWSV